MSYTSLFKRPRSIGQAGVTLVEMLIVMGLLAIFIAVMATIFTSVISTQVQSEGYSATLSDTRFINARLGYDIRRAGSVTMPAALGSTASSLTLVIDGDNYTYSLSGGDLQLTDTTGSDNLNGDGTKVSGLSFQRIGNPGGKDTVRYSFTVTNAVKHTGGDDTQTITSTVELR